MPRFIDKLRRALREESLGEVAAKVRDNLIALARGRAALRKCDRVGRRPRAFGMRPAVYNQGRIEVGDFFAVGGAFGAVEIAAGPHARLSIGDEVTINYGTTVSARQRIRIGDRCKIAPFCVLSDSEVPMPLGLDPGDRPAPIDLGSDVWLGARVVVLPGVTIGDRAVISAGSVVTEDIPAGAIASGNPARTLRVSRPPVSPRAEPRRVRHAKTTTEKHDVAG